MTQEKNANGKARVMILAGLLLVLAGLVAAPTASAATVHPGGGGCLGEWWNTPGDGSFETFFGAAGHFVDCVL